MYDLVAPARRYVSPKGIRVGLYSAYTPIEIDIPRKVGPQQNEEEQCITRHTFASPESGGIAGKTARDLIHSVIPVYRGARIYCSSSPEPPLA